MKNHFKIILFVFALLTFSHVSIAGGMGPNPPGGGMGPSKAAGLQEIQRVFLLMVE
ncbi:MAG: hypothetical protein IPG89_17660 [Bacteroidetes bacterium]|nr:hypothetical protein [Bacteroidota bacterium]